MTDSVAAENSCISCCQRKVQLLLSRFNNAVLRNRYCLGNAKFGWVLLRYKCGNFGKTAVVNNDVAQLCESA